MLVKQLAGEPRNGEADLEQLNRVVIHHGGQTVMAGLVGNPGRKE